MAIRELREVDPDDVVDLRQQDGGWLVLVADVPIGFCKSDTSIVTPSGATYSIAKMANGVALRDRNSLSVASLDGQVVRDDVSGVEWALHPDWITTSVYGEPTEPLIHLPEAYAAVYTLEDAQGTVPNRVKLLLAWILTRTVMNSEGT